MTSTSTARVDMHCHSTASQEAKLGIQSSMGLPECATPPQEVYELAKSRGMDFVTITDHDTIDGCLEIADRPDVFVSEELTAWFKDEPQAVHVLCYGITPEDHADLQANAADLETCAAYLREREIACALAHPFFFVAAPLEARHRRRLAELFGVWEVRNGSRARDLNTPRGGLHRHPRRRRHRRLRRPRRRRHRPHLDGDPVRVDAGRVSTRISASGSAERARRPGQRRQVGARGPRARGALAAGGRRFRWAGRAHAPRPGAGARDAGRHRRSGARGRSRRRISARTRARALLRGWLESVNLGRPRSPREVIAVLQSRRLQPRRPRTGGPAAIHEAAAAQDAVDGARRARRTRAAELAEGRQARSSRPASRRFPTCRRWRSWRVSVPGWRPARASPRRVGLVVDGAGSVHGVTQDGRADPRARGPRLRGRGDRHRPQGGPPAPGRRRGRDAVLRGRSHRHPQHPRAGRDPGRRRLRAAPPGLARAGGGRGRARSADRRDADLRQLPHRARRLHADPHRGPPARGGDGGWPSRLFYGQAEVVLSPSAAADASLEALGIDPDRIGRWVRGRGHRVVRPARAGERGRPSTRSG